MKFIEMKNISNGDMEMFNKLKQKFVLLVVMICAVAGFIACEDKGKEGPIEPQGAASLVGTKWKYVAYVSYNDPTGIRSSNSASTLELLEDGTFSDIDGFGTYRIDADSMFVYLHYQYAEEPTVYKYIVHEDGEETELRLDFVRGRMTFSMDSPIAWIYKLIGE